ncbi:MAG: type II toxin-antitoxin system prevent-host-death family antitoxin [Sedimenticola sp.]
MKATTKDLRLHTRELISATDRGEQVIITYRGKPRAKLVPFTAEGTGAPGEHNPAFGIWSDRDDDLSVDEQVRQMRRPRSFG